MNSRNVKKKKIFQNAKHVSKLLNYNKVTVNVDLFGV